MSACPTHPPHVCQNPNKQTKPKSKTPIKNQKSSFNESPIKKKERKENHNNNNAHLSHIKRGHKGKIMANMNNNGLEGRQACSSHEAGWLSATKQQYSEIIC